jgi:hypothetical protein
LPLCTISRRIGQAAELLLGHLSGPVRLCKLNLKEGDLTDRALIIFMSRCLCCGVLPSLT